MTEGVQAMPTFAFFKNGEKLNQVKRISKFSDRIPRFNWRLSERLETDPRVIMGITLLTFFSVCWGESRADRIYYRYD